MIGERFENAAGDGAALAWERVGGEGDAGGHEGSDGAAGGAFVGHGDGDVIGAEGEVGVGGSAAFWAGDGVHGCGIRRFWGWRFPRGTWRFGV